MAASILSLTSPKETASKTDITGYHNPIARYGHSTKIVGDKMFLWCGGQTVVPIIHNGAKKEDFSSNIEYLNLKTGKWEHRQARGFSPSGIQYYTVTSVAKMMYYFGGHCGHSGCYYNSLNKFDTSIYKWDEVKVNNLLEQPIEKYSSGMVNFKSDSEDYLFTIGGYGKFGEFRQPGAVYTEAQGTPECGRTNEQHIFSLSTGFWINPAITGDSPPPCSNFSFTAINNNRAVLFGGFQNSTRSNDVYIGTFTKDSVHWTKHEQNGAAMWPCARSDHAADYVLGHRMRQTSPVVVMMGGIDNTGSVLGDIWLYYVDQGAWQKLDLPSCLVGRLHHSMSVINIGSEFVWLMIFGGIISWKKGKSARDQELVNTTNVIELIWDKTEDKWKHSTVIPIEGESFAQKYTKELKEKLQRQKSQ